MGVEDWGEVVGSARLVAVVVVVAGMVEVDVAGWCTLLLFLPCCCCCRRCLNCYR